MIKQATPNDYPYMQVIWERAVRATHDFLKEADFQYYKSQLPHYFNYVDLYIYKDRAEEIKGFLGVAADKIEMLFVDPEARGSGVGKSFIEFAVDELNAVSVDVNEQNHQAVGFYLHLGFVVVGRSEVDGEGRAYPLLNLKK